MSHIYGYGLNCPNAKGIIHLGATSCYVTDNADALIYIDALKLVIKKVLNVIANLAEFAEQYKDLPTLGDPFSACTAYDHCWQTRMLVDTGLHA